jgi:hypothetical protein
MSRIQPKQEIRPGCCNGKVETFLGSCDRKPTVCRDGVDYCWQHDPVRLAAQRHERWLKRKDEIKAEEARFEAKFRREDLIRKSGVQDLTDQDLQQIVAAGGIWAFLPWRPGETDASVED